MKNLCSGTHHGGISILNRKMKAFYMLVEGLKHCCTYIVFDFWFNPPKKNSKSKSYYFGEFALLVWFMNCTTSGIVLSEFVLSRDPLYLLQSLQMLTNTHYQWQWVYEAYPILCSLPFQPLLDFPVQYIQYSCVN